MYFQTLAINTCIYYMYSKFALKDQNYLKALLENNIGLQIDGELCFDKSIIAERFNSFYSTVAPKLVEKLPERLNKFGKSCVEKFYLDNGVLPKAIRFLLYQKTKS